jgi:uncharacterized protein (DUF58 family)
MAIRNLELRARIVVEGFWHGLHRSPYHGFSVEFTEYRQYSPGDDPRYLDWRLYARSDRHYIKKFEDETNLRCHLLVDASRSMAFGSVGYPKSEYANTLAATLAYFLSLQGDAVGLLSFDEQIRASLPARNRPGHLRRLMLSLDQPASGRATNLAAPLETIVQTVRKRSLLVLISDFLAPVSAFSAQLAALAACHHEIVVFQVLDPAEVAFDFSKAILFEDIESGQSLFIEPSVARSEYLRKFAAHTEALRTACHEVGAYYRRLATNDPLEIALFDFLRERTARQRRVRQRG